MKQVGTTDSRGDATIGNTGELGGKSIDRVITVNYNFLSTVCFHFDIPDRDMVQSCMIYLT
jgi:hypothetical protein